MPGTNRLVGRPRQSDRIAPLRRRQAGVTLAGAALAVLVALIVVGMARTGGSGRPPGGGDTAPAAPDGRFDATPGHAASPTGSPWPPPEPETWREALRPQVPSMTPAALALVDDAPWAVPTTRELTVLGDGRPVSAPVPRPEGTRVLAVRGSLLVSADTLAGTIRVEVIGDGPNEEVIGSDDVVVDPAPLPRSRSLPFVIRTPTGSATRLRVTGDLTGRTEPAGAAAECRTAAFTVADLSSDVAGSAIAPARVDQLLLDTDSGLDRLRRVDVVVPAQPTDAETQAALVVAAAIGAADHRSGRLTSGDTAQTGLGRSSDVVVSTRLPVPDMGLSPIERRRRPVIVIDSRAPAGASLSTLVDGRPVVVLGGPSAAITDAARRLYPVDRTATQGTGVNGAVRLLQDAAEPIGAEGVGTLRLRVPITQSGLGGPSMAARLDLALRHRALLRGEAAIASVVVGETLVRSVALTGDGQRIEIEVPAAEVRRDVEVRLEVLRQGPPGCGDRLPLRVELAPSSTITVTRGQPLPVSFERYPQVLLPRVTVELVDRRPTSIGLAARLVRELAAVSDAAIHPDLSRPGSADPAPDTPRTGAVLRIGATDERWFDSVWSTRSTDGTVAAGVPDAALIATTAAAGAGDAGPERAPGDVLVLGWNASLDDRTGIAAARRILDRVESDGFLALGGDALLAGRDRVTNIDLSAPAPAGTAASSSPPGDEAMPVGAGRSWADSALGMAALLAAGVCLVGLASLGVQRSRAGLKQRRLVAGSVDESAGSRADAAGTLPVDHHLLDDDGLWDDITSGSAHPLPGGASRHRRADRGRDGDQAGHLGRRSTD